MPPPPPDSAPQPLAGQVVVFTGKLSSLGRRDARALVERMGGAAADTVSARTTMLVVGGEGFAPGAETSLKLKRAETMAAEQRLTIAILTEVQFCRLVGVPTPEDVRSQYHALRDLLVRYRSVREDHLRYLVKCGLIAPVMRTNADTLFAFHDVAVIKQTNDAMDAGRSFQSVVGGLLAAREGQLALDFRLDAAPAKVLTLQPRLVGRAIEHPGARNAAVDAALAEEYFTAGSALDTGDESTRDAAATAYRQALELDPHLVAALINLANIHYSRDQNVEALALYERAIALEPDVFEAHFNLGNIYHDLSRFADARACYEEALRLNPYYADTCFYLAVTLEKMGLSREAKPHWRTYQRLSPQGEWVALAKEFAE